MASLCGGEGEGITSVLHWPRGKEGQVCERWEEKSFNLLNNMDGCLAISGLWLLQKSFPIK